MSVGLLAQVMTEAELQDWERYAERHQLPHRRMELYMAQIALVVAVSFGGRDNLTLADFLIRPEEVNTTPDAEPTAEEEAEFFEFRPRSRVGG